ncbi:hydro-lyases, Fe-S type, tartrate/fumarate subfamily, beta region [Tepidanaerobacter acetatoxydans Re1]|uniref:Hydro-lyases, Fe-S type, tartrate/fumarate subfamily, beta region n=1 Tax=Tepidanaerobacter acetatoxydans (strain DSM 21804 / JCM 16047 / Re1) TaxID=1209989 RepID=F4LVE0_TEPAE|nr:FumA C-terminus/TtdB family hydratase beta subunit [Tepidanaerobacter acetatoxydans]AEE90715.1 hydro-lyase, Fe-S type, tartrate/fumarate subfamily, beta subunit [Tepidanaerobacter acetatoxydans Re1]CCP25256.1 hydro-lyases, Fe-S type, tartrate/fumarate subfamily, beta region [Tepidanaerobacter acetatoxydans Re1]
MKINLPITKEIAKSFKVGDELYLTGFLYTARDAAHKRIKEAIESNGELPIELKNQTIFYTGPTPAKPGWKTGSIGPTTSSRMDPFVEIMLQHGVTAMIGKGQRADYVADLCKEYGAVYLLGIGGLSALYTKNIKSVEVVAYEDLGTESIKKLYVENLRVLVGIDTEGRILQNEEIKKYRISD